MKSYETIIGLEIHAELNTKTKIFCNCSTEFGAEPNAHTCPVCMGLPGTLPVLNKEVIKLAIKAGKILGCKINKVNKMDRKNYFYPDLPKAYQISQFDLPICSGGSLEFELDGVKRKVSLNRIHIEEDAGKLVHLADEPVSLIDYNRVGVPLAEIVTEPDLRSPKEAVTFMKTLRSMLQYGGISDCRMEQGSLRCDANISMREVGSDKLNCKVEIKNISSFRELQKALEKEEKRQRELYNFGEEFKIKQETRRWDAGKGKTVAMRSKEDANDYRYFPDPDLAPIIIRDNQIEKIEESIPELPKAKKARFIRDYKLGNKEVDILIDDKRLGEFFEATVKCGADPKTTANWILVDVLRILKEKEMDSSSMNLEPEKLYKLIKIVSEGKISATAAKEVFDDMFESGKDPEDIVKEKGLTQISSSDVLDEIIQKVLGENPKSVEDYKAGKTQAAGYLVGQVMKASKGKANPKLARELIISKLQ
ncbi:Asp-tRNA(Asn)/Glu-tRNA(Gln) amidotransferase subunit GatB [Clostridium fermenticellae]|uniref:Aspartyl/glutamyl-tRNA(Asn/Gln) amidotransferase subunit B n=1 Tax=Clostridium fermenticellae TaxID=2068654 RepID=A0A386H4N2_9CLOT|nr:Asp-tRNA(Asn)/Glu-tRNA(Gln) amidotransferase subunit GatB [Clostridium fermenticellae]AYD40518.1 Asp-tRNA(Asn)/Glu-tRNA(Gln) amidotransferase subunit GatB [Clostridium fermenticellae]